eukprot:jgi/Orpsp1_1/1175068/evm.model.c7180000052517.1
MKFNFKLFSILSIATTTTINTVGAFNITSTFKFNFDKSSDIKEKLINNNGISIDPNEDQYYMIFVDNNFSEDGSLNKREEIKQHLNALANEINNLIINNKDTYKDISKLEEIQQKKSALKKRENESEDINDNEESKLSYLISSLEDRSIIYSYLSKDLEEVVKSLPNVMACVADRRLFASSYKNYNLDDIKEETQWSGVNVRENSDIHLSLLSQGKYDDKLIGQYDKNYYYPESAGEDVDIFIFDSGFNFRHSEFSNKDDRTTKCIFTVKDAEIIPTEDDKFCEPRAGKNKEMEYHGELVADVVAGLTHGIAPKSNIYGVSIDDTSVDYDPEDFESNNYSEFYTALWSGIIAGLQHIRDNMLRPNKAIFNFSLGLYLNQFKKEDQYIVDYWRDMIDEISNEGAVFVVSAGNESKQIDIDEEHIFYPCSFDNVICVGAIDNFGMNTLQINYNDELDELVSMYDRQEIDADTFYEEYYKLRNKYDTLQVEYYQKYYENNMNSEYYRPALFSNFGKKVDIYAPGFVFAEYKDINGEDTEEIGAGTSFSSPLVAGVAATIMSEHPDIKFNSKTMLKYLKEIGEKDIIEGIEEGNPNIFLNNGKHIVYSQDDQYYGCGLRSGNQSCSKGLSCSDEGYCVLSEEKAIEPIDLNDEDIFHYEEKSDYVENLPDEIETYRINEPEEVEINDIIE